MTTTTTTTNKIPLTIDELVKVTNFTKLEIERLQGQFSQLNPINERVDRPHFRDLLCDKFGIDDSLLMDRVFRCFDIDADNYISFDEFVKGMSVFLRGKFDEQIKFCFRIYDLNGDRYISKEEMFQLLKNCMVKGAEEDEDGAKDLVDLVLKKLDEDRDGRVSEADYITAITKENLLLEAFGQCLPHHKDVESFLGDIDLSMSIVRTPRDSSSTNITNNKLGSSGLVNLQRLQPHRQDTTSPSLSRNALNSLPSSRNAPRPLVPTSNLKPTATSPRKSERVA